MRFNADYDVKLMNIIKTVRPDSSKICITDADFKVANSIYNVTFVKKNHKLIRDVLLSLDSLEPNLIVYALANPVIKNDYELEKIITVVLGSLVCIGLFIHLIFFMF